MGKRVRAVQTCFSAGVRRRAGAVWELAEGERMGKGMVPADTPVPEKPPAPKEPTTLSEMTARTAKEFPSEVNDRYEADDSLL